ncbi:hypothetical protein A9Q84_18860 [Halobacteriovorax marinus]|uniref:N-acetyltransferase domain-containing protein n=1 Tax=Halobacteriovorax marinus TaxID=97084 RepID=A0A1Y5F2J0_9BACT|nr:hypothetical protein A9Q84_18860 [Halobacteriovorax marinus]
MNSDYNIEIKELHSQDTKILEEALILMNRTQGDGLFNMNYLVSRIERQDALALGAFVDGDLVSVGCAEMITEFSYYVPFEENILERLKGHKVGSLCTLCVREDFQGKGIGQLISKRRMDWLKNNKCNLILGISWLSGLSHTSDRVFNKLGFHLISDVDEFFKESAIKYPFNCPGCHTQPCKCSAALYQYDINN